jgi:hypothetical protein
LPVPLAPDVTVIHVALLAAVQLHVPADAATPTLALPAAALGDAPVGDSVNEHGAAACVTVNVWPAIVTVPVRAAPAFAATE